MILSEVTPSSLTSPPPVPPPDLKKNRKVALWVALGAALIASTVGTVLLSGQSKQPKMTWSVPSLELTLSPGETATRSLTLTSDTTVTDVRLEAVPEIAPFLTIEPSSIGTLSANQPQNVQISFNIPTDTALGTYDGTIHVRIGTQTLSQPFKLVLNIWNLVVDTDNSYSFKYPPGATLAHPAVDTTVLFPPGANTEDETPNISVVVRPNPTQKSIFQYYDGIAARNLFEHSDQQFRTGLISGYPYYEFFPTVTFGGERIIVIIRPSDFMEVTDNGYAFEGSQSSFDDILNTLSLD